MKTLLRFLQNGKTQFHVAALAKEYLDAHNFTQISDRENLTELAAGRYYLAPFSSIVIPFVKGAQSTQVRIACAHTDFPMLKVKPNPELKKLGYLQINVEPYGGLIKETWFDRPLGLAGKVILKGDTSFHPEVRLFEPCSASETWRQRRRTGCTEGTDSDCRYGLARSRFPFSAFLCGRKTKHLSR